MIVIIIFVMHLCCSAMLARTYSSSWTTPRGQPTELKHGGWHFVGKHWICSVKGLWRQQISPDPHRFLLVLLINTASTPHPSSALPPLVMAGTRLRPAWSKWGPFPVCLALAAVEVHEFHGSEMRDVNVLKLIYFNHSADRGVCVCVCVGVVMGGKQ